MSLLSMSEIRNGKKSRHRGNRLELLIQILKADILIFLGII